MKLKDFLHRCVSDYLSASIYEGNIATNDWHLITRVKRLDDVYFLADADTGINIGEREIDAFSISKDKDGILRWVIALEK